MTQSSVARNGRRVVWRSIWTCLIAVIGIGATAGCALAQSCSLPSPVSWALGANGNWGAGANWSGGAYPDSAGTNACITDKKSTVTLNVDATVGSLQLAKGNTLKMDPGTTLNVAGPKDINSGFIDIDAGSGKNTVYSIGDNVSLSGGVLSTGVLFTGLILNSGNGGTAYVRGAGHTLTNIDNVIQGAGDIGDDGMNLVNGNVGLGGSGIGTIIANVSGGTLNIGSGGGSFVNYFGVEVMAGSTLEVTADKNGFVQVGGFTDVFGNLIVPHGFSNSTSTHSGDGIIDGYGTITGNVVNGSSLDPEYRGAEYGSGALTIVGNYDQLAAGSFTVNSNAHNNQLVVQGAVSLHGALDVFGPSGVQEIMSYTSHSGNFSSLDYNDSSCVSTGVDVWKCGYYRATEEFGRTSLYLDISGVPEPSTSAMLLAGFAALGLVGYRASRRPVPSVN